MSSAMSRTTKPSSKVKFVTPQRVDTPMAPKKPKVYPPTPYPGLAVTDNLSVEEWAEGLINPMPCLESEHEDLAANALYLMSISDSLPVPP